MQKYEKKAHTTHPFQPVSVKIFTEALRGKKSMGATRLSHALANVACENTAHEALPRVSSPTGDNCIVAPQKLISNERNTWDYVLSSGYR